MTPAAAQATAGHTALLKQAGLVVLFALWAAALVILFFTAPRLYSLPLIAATLVPVILHTSRNPRLFFLMGMVATSVSGLSINIDRHVHVGGAPSYSLDLMDLFMVPLLFFLVRDLIQGRRRSIRMSSLSLWWLGLIVIGALSVLFGPFRQFAAFEVVRMVKCWLLFLVIINECVRERHFHHVVAALSWALLVNLLIAGAQYALKRDLGLQALGEAATDAVQGANLSVYLRAGEVFRVSALLGHPNLFAAYLAMLLPILTALIFTDYSERLKIALAALCGLALAGLVLTLSRTGWVAYAAATLCLLLFLHFHPAMRSRWNRLKRGLLIGIGFAGLLAAGPVISRLTNSDPGALDFRYEWVGISWEMIKAKPVFGFGLNSFSYQIIGYVPYSVSRLVEMFGTVWPVVHNTYLLVWAEQGTIAVILFVGMNLHLLWLA
ncbi:MAG: O-antigen ligase domain-containing protein, partial [Haliea sp.]